MKKGVSNDKCDREDKVNINVALAPQEQLVISSDIVGI